MGAGDDYLGAAGGVAYLDDIDLDAVALAEVFALDALVGAEHGLSILAVGGDADGYRAVSGLDMAHNTGEDFMLLGGKLLIDQAALGLADALDDDLLCRLGGNAAELFGLHRDGNKVAKLGAAAVFLRGLEIDLMAGIRHLVHDGFHHVHLDAFFVLVENDLHVVLALGVVAAEGRQHGLTDFVVHIIAGDSLFLLNVLDGFKKFCVHADSLSCSK